MQFQLPASDDLLASYALIVYQNAQKNDGCIMRHSIGIKGDQLVLGPGTGVTKGFLKTLEKMGGHTHIQYIPENVIAYGLNYMAWTSEATSRPLLFQGAADKGLQELDGQSFPQPRLLFIVKNQRLCIFALKGTERPTPQTPLYKAPYFNLLPGEEMCKGSARIPKAGDLESIPKWEEVFFLSNFVHGNGTKRWNFDGSYKEMWEAARTLGAFQEDWLVPHNMTLREVLHARP